MKRRKLTFYLTNFILGGCVFASPAALCSKEKLQESLSSHEDWVIDSSYAACGGYYRPPPNGMPAERVDSVNLPIFLEADHFNYSLEGISTLIGNVKVSQGEKTMQAPKALISTNKDTQDIQSIDALGPVEYVDPYFRIWSERVNWDSAHQILNMENATFHYYPHHGRGIAKHIRRTESGRVELKHASYTTCPPGSNTWRLEASHLTLNQKSGRGKARHLLLKMKDVPVFYLPYFDFPLDKKRKTGWLYPNFNSTTESGFSLQAPFYWNIAPNYDATITPTYLTARGLLLATDTRYLTKHSQGGLAFHWLPNDQKYREFRRINRASTPTLPPGDPRLDSLNGGNHRFATTFKDHSKFSSRLVGNVSYSYVSDDNYFLDLGNDLDTANTSDLLQQAELLYYGPHWHHTLRAQSYQSLHPLYGPINDDEYERLPQWAFSASYPQIWQNLQLDTSGEWVNYYHNKNPFLGTTITQGQRIQLRPALSVPFASLSGYVTPRVQWDMLQYNLDLSPQDSANGHPSQVFRTIPMYDVKAGLFFDRFTRVLNQDYLQTLEPKLYYLYVPFRDQTLYPNFDSNLNTFNFSQLFRDNRFAGRDRIGDANQLTLSMTSRWLVKQTGQERFNASIGEIFYFEPRRVTVCDPALYSNDCRLLEDPTANNNQSALIGQVSMDLQPLKAWAFVEWDPKTQSSQQASYNLEWAHLKGGQINFGYYWVRQDPANLYLNTTSLQGINTLQNLGTPQDTQQTDVSVIWPFAKHFEVLSRWQYDLVQNRTINLLGGVAYHGCCFSWQLAASRYIKPQQYDLPNEYRRGIFLTVAFRGLSSVGTKDSQFDKMIPGYQRLRHRNQWKISKMNN